jgi:hypothetical protein
VKVLVSQHAILRARQRWKANGSHLAIQTEIREAIETATRTRDARGGREWQIAGRRAVLTDVTLDGDLIVITVGTISLKQLRWRT